MASLKDIATELGVSFTLVSKVLNGRLGTTGVSEKTREAILQKAREVNYVPNRTAVDLKAGRKGAIGIFLHHMGALGSDVSDRLLKGMSTELSKSGTRMWLHFFTTDEDFLTACNDQLKNAVDGLIVAGVCHPELLPKLKHLNESGLPTVSIFNENRHPVSKYTTNVITDYKRQAYLATSHLLRSGCKRLACLDTLQNRTDGFIEAHQDAGVPLIPRLQIKAHGFEHTHGEESLAHLLALKIPFEGIVCQSDTQAAGVINGLTRLGIRVPEDVRVTGIDNSPAANHCIVPITSVTSEMGLAGMKAIETLFDKIAGKPVSSTTLPPRLIIRKSCGTEEQSAPPHADTEASPQPARVILKKKTPPRPRKRVS